MDINPNGTVYYNPTYSVSANADAQSSALLRSGYFAQAATLADNAALLGVTGTRNAAPSQNASLNGGDILDLSATALGIVNGGGVAAPTPAPSAAPSSSIAQAETNLDLVEISPTPGLTSDLLASVPATDNIANPDDLTQDVTVLLQQQNMENDNNPLTLSLQELILSANAILSAYIDPVNTLSNQTDIAVA
jgi:hypothetical protein